MTAPPMTLTKALLLGMHFSFLVAPGVGPALVVVSSPVGTMRRAHARASLEWHVVIVMGVLTMRLLRWTLSGGFHGWSGINDIHWTFQIASAVLVWVADQIVFGLAALAILLVLAGVTKVVQQEPLPRPREVFNRFVQQTGDGGVGAS